MRTESGVVCTRMFGFGGNRLQVVLSLDALAWTEPFRAEPGTVAPGILLTRSRDKRDSSSQTQKQARGTCPMSRGEGGWNEGHSRPRVGAVVHRRPGRAYPVGENVSHSI